MAVCLITGGAGFMGSHLVDALVARGDRVRVLDNLSTGTLTNLVQARDAIELIAADLNDPDVLPQAVRNVDYVFHFMAPAHVTLKGPDFSPGKWAYAADTLNILMAAREARVKRVLFASSAAVYGTAANAEVKESDPLMPISPYGFAKQTGENQCAGFTLLYGLETVRLRFFNIFGPRQCQGTLYAPTVPSILRAMLGGQNPVLLDNPFDQQDFLYVSDAIHATLLAAEASRVAGKVYNIARGRTASLVQVVATANQILGTNLQPLFSDFRPHSGQVRSVNVSRSEADLGFCPSNDLRQGLSRFIDYLTRESPGTVMSVPETDDFGLKGPHFFDHRRPCPLSSPADPGGAATPENN